MSISLKRSRRQDDDDDEDVTSSTKESGEILFWKNNYYEMKKLKEEAEADLQAEKKLRTNKEDILTEGLILMKQRQGSIKDNGIEDESKSPEKEIYNNERLLKIIKFYESMTAMTVKTKEEDKFCCTIKNSSTRQAARFFISNSTADGEFLYEPSANASLFPQYMNDEALSFVPEMGPVLLGDAIASMFVEDVSGDEEEEEGSDDTATGEEDNK